MIVEALPGAPPHFFLIGFRAVPGNVGPSAEQRGVVVTRTLLDFAGTPLPAGAVRTEDEAFAGQPKSGPFRHEAEIAVWKPVPDVAVVADLASFLTPTQIADADALPETIAAAPFGTLAVDRGAGFGPPTLRSFGHRPRGSGVRLGLAGDPGAAGDPASLTGFDPDQFDLPRGFDNGFANSAPLPGAAPFAPGDRLRFAPNAGPPVPDLTIPAAPVLTITGTDPAPVLVPTVDTITVDRTAAQFALVWRASFPWEARFETATLNVMGTVQ